MALPPPAPRTALHTRTIHCEGFRRDDGLWDIEARLRDTKAYDFAEPGRGERPAGSAVHDMHVRLTLDDQMTVCDVQVWMESHPYEDFVRAIPSFSDLVGKRVGPGWRRAVMEAAGGERGCTHVRELLLPMATVAFQTMVGWASKERSAGKQTPTSQRPYFIGGCLGWALDGEQVARFYPEFHVRNDPR
jgi:Protein of unknown function (DUF2889)